MKRCVTVAACWALGIGLLLTGCASASRPAPVVDGVFDEWRESDRIATDPRGDAAGAFDLTDVWARSDGARLVLRFALVSALNLQAGDEADGTLRAEIGLADGRRLTVDFRARTLLLDGATSDAVTWRSVRLLVMPTYAAREYEMQVDLSALGVRDGQAVTIDFSGSDSLSAPARFVLERASRGIRALDTGRARGVDWRFASLNTMRTGTLSTPERVASLGRLVRSAGADIVCMQEEYESSEEQLGAFLTAHDPRSGGWAVHKHNDCAVAAPASRARLHPLPSNDSSFAAAVVEPVAGADAVIVFSVHPKCCGYTGSEEDARRMAQMERLLTTLEGVRTGAFGRELERFRSAPAVIIGDWNLVGSRGPLDMVEDAAGPGMRAVVVRNTATHDTATWFGIPTGPGSFPPGRLDLVAHSSPGLRAVRACLVDTGAMKGSMLRRLGLRAEDSAATDHLLMVVDLVRGE